MLTRTELQQMITECKQDLNTLGLSVPPTKYELSKRMTRAFGITQFEIDGISDMTITIRINHLLNYNIGRNTMLHEMLHAILGPNVSHGQPWLTLADRVNRAFPNKYNIVVYADITKDAEVQETLIANAKAKGGGVVTCLSCGIIQTVTKRHGILVNPQNYSCGKCNGKVKVEKF